MLENNKKTFSFDFEGKTITIPDIKHIPNAAIRKTRHILDDVDKSYTIIELVVGEDSEAMEAFDKMTVEEFTAVISDWTQGASLGESSGSES
jgi:hypothetical protein